MTKEKRKRLKIEENKESREAIPTKHNHPWLYVGIKSSRISKAGGGCRGIRA
jgi:hypothetical protein